MGDIPFDTVPEMSRPPSPRLSPPRLLVVDDDPDARLLLAAMIEAYFGADVVLVASVGEAIDSVSRVLPDLILSDGVMPGEDALDLVRRLRGIARAAAVPVIVVTASIDAPFATRLREAGVKAVLGKPPEPEALTQAIVGALASSEN